MRSYAPSRIKALRKERGYSLEALGAAMPSDLTASSVAKLENSRMGLSADYLLEIAKVLRVSPAEILGDTIGGAIRLVPVIAQVNAGNWGDAVGEAAEMLPVPIHLKGANLFALRPLGDSMDKIVAEGGFVVVDPDQRELIDKKFYVLMNEHGETTFKQFCSSPLALLPCSTNGDHAPIPVGSSPFTVVGRVVYAGQNL